MSSNNNTKKIIGRSLNKVQRIDTSLGAMRYLVTDFLKAIEERPATYDPMYDNLERSQFQLLKQLWKSIAVLLFPPFDNLPQDEQQFIISKKLKRSWRLLRVSYMKAVQLKRSGDPRFQPFIFVKEMEFFRKVKGISPADIPEDPAQPVNIRSIKSQSTNNSSQPRTPQASRRLRQRNSDVVYSPHKKASNKSRTSTLQTSPGKDQNETNISSFDPMFFCRATTNGGMDTDEVPHVEEISSDEDTKEAPTDHQYVQVNSVHSMADNEADNAFFESIKPSLRKMRESQKLDFKIEVLQLVKKYQK